MRALILTLIFLNLGFFEKRPDKETDVMPHLGGDASTFFEFLGKPDHQKRGLLGMTTEYIWGDNETNYTSIRKDLTGKVIMVSVMHLEEVENLNDVDWAQIRLNALVHGTLYDKSEPEDWQLSQKGNSKTDSTWTSKRTGNVVHILLTKKEEDSLAGYLAVLGTPNESSRDNNLRFSRTIDRSTYLLRK